MTQTQTAKRELSKANVYEAIDLATKQFIDSCYDLGLSVEKSKRIMYSKEGLDVILKQAAKLI